ncbi:MAG: hypothetical protein KJN89_05900 [Gammaproteobacteria bacterium]|nr:hypothetical protein [Gammaproteobacteria bacterium]MBT8134527.1 hypothetical protein [Gammaproteobacteria bacterium]NNJ49889.1 hypothetical protein [Gammaproteobacteria bacterium]
MIKRLLTFKLLPAILTLGSASAMAHPGHLPNDAVHGLLHIEHIIALAAAGVIAYLAYRIRKK